LDVSEFESLNRWTTKRHRIFQALDYVGIDLVFVSDFNQKLAQSEQC